MDILKINDPELGEIDAIVFVPAGTEPTQADLKKLDDDVAGLLDELEAEQTQPAPTE